MNPIYLAIDTADAFLAQQMIDEVRDYIGGVKLAPTFLFANGPAVISHTVRDLDWFFDAKLHDIPIQVAGAIRAIMPLKPTYITVHIGRLQPNASEEDRWKEDLMMRAAVDAASDESAKLSVPRPKLLGVTVLTHLSASLTEITMMAHRGLSCGLDGVVSSPRELRTLRDELGTKPILLTPGIRSADLPVMDDDQSRTATAQEAVADGANVIVVGRPITQAADRRRAAQRLLESLG